MNKENKDAREFWERLEAAQEEYGRVTLQGLCRLIDAPYQTLINQKCQCRYPSIPTLMKLATTLNVSTDWLLFGVEKLSKQKIETLVNKVRNASPEQLAALDIFLKK
jgi:hypothetical protein